MNNNETLEENLKDKVERVLIFLKNLKNADPTDNRFSTDFVIDGVLAILNDDIHLEYLYFGPLTENDIKTANNIAEMVGWENE